MSKPEPESRSLARLPRTFHVTATTKPQVFVKENSTRKGLLAYNNGAAKVFILSGQSVGKEDGIPVTPGSAYVNRTCYGEYWIVADSGSQDVRGEEDTD